MRETKQSQARTKEESSTHSSGRAPWLDEPETEPPIPPGAKLVWDEAAGKLVVRLPKAKWK